MTKLLESELRELSEQEYADNLFMQYTIGMEETRDKIISIIENLPLISKEEADYKGVLIASIKEIIK